MQNNRLKNMINSEFTKHSSTYNSYNIIQNEVSKRLIQKIDTKPKTVLELGSGSGVIYSKIDWEIDRFIGIDFSLGMCNLHPKTDKIDIYNSDFDDFDYSKFDTNSFDAIISSSALQWSKNIPSLIKEFSRLSKNHYFAIFTNQTFYKLFDYLGIDSPLPSLDYYHDSFGDNYKYEVLRYTLEFDTIKEVFQYIKKSGVSGGAKRLSYKEAKQLYNNYPYKNLEFEIVLITN
jgi:malonyl-CoA O-methyltransferase